VSALSNALFAPTSIAIIGASADTNKHSSLVQRHLRQHGYTGAIYPVNARRSEVLGEPAFPSLRAIGKPVDHVFVNVPTDAVMGAIEDCAEVRASCVTVLSNGFAESGPDGAVLQNRVLDVARAGGVRLLGPNSIGLVNTAAHLALSSNEALSAPTLLSGRYGLVSQSGSMLGALLSRGHARGIGFSKLVSVGNEADLGVGEIGEMLINDPDTDAILLFLETVRDPAALAAMARRAYDAGKPVVAFRLGRSELGAKLASSHTGALAGSGAALDALLRACGIVCVHQLETLLEIPPLLIGRRPPPGGRAAVMTTTGGGGGLVVDCFSEQGIEIVGPNPALIETLAARDVKISSSTLIDLTLAGTNPQTYGVVLEALLASPHCDLVAAVVGSSAQFRPDRAVQPILDASQRWPERPLVVYLTPQAEQSLALLAQHGIAAFRTAEGCADAVRAFHDWQAPVAPSGERAPDAVAALLAPGGPGRAAAGARLVFAALGIPQTQATQLPPLADPPADALAGIRYPVAVKVLSPDIAHKTEAGGVVLGVADAHELRAACALILQRVGDRRPDARIEGLVVETMERGLAEVLVGYRLDPCAGPTVVVGVGGVLAEIYRDVTVRTAPVSMAVALEMIAEIRGLAAIRGFRDLPRGDVDALAQAIQAMSRLAFVPAVAEAEINPVLVRAAGEGVIALDGVIVCTP
jgi:acyl-CoA synthetase (NDP forming)